MKRIILIISLVVFSSNIYAQSHGEICQELEDRISLSTQAYEVSLLRVPPLIATYFLMGCLPHSFDEEMIESLQCFKEEVLNLNLKLVPTANLEEIQDIYSECFKSRAPGRRASQSIPRGH